MRGALEAARRKWVAVIIMTIYHLKMVAENMMKTCDKDYQSQAKQTKSFVFHFGSPWLMCCNVHSYLAPFCTNCPSLVLLITSLANERRDDGRLSLLSDQVEWMESITVCIYSQRHILHWHSGRCCGRKGTKLRLWYVSTNQSVSSVKWHQAKAFPADNLDLKRLH